MISATPLMLTINGGSSSIKFALFEAGNSLLRILEDGIERIGMPEATLRVKGLKKVDNFSRSVPATDHAVAVGALMDWIEGRIGRGALTAVGHRVVHGGSALMHEAMATTLDTVMEQIKSIQHNARVSGNLTRPRWPMIVLKSPKGWTGP